MSMKILYLHWVEGTPQLCQFPGVSGTSIVFQWHLVSFIVPIVSLQPHSPHFLHSDKCNRSGQGHKTVDDSQSSWKSAKGVCVHGWSAQTEAIQTEAKLLDRGKQQWMRVRMP